MKKNKLETLSQCNFLHKHSRERENRLVAAWNRFSTNNNGQIMRLNNHYELWPRCRAGWPMVMLIESILDDKRKGRGKRLQLLLVGTKWNEPKPTIVELIFIAGQ
ncbi:hypothetical protein BLOT_000017 [Blomia tropicalis]|nr:hypothetical protein BLOT_000017 [Blomia tropicalis]